MAGAGRVGGHAKVVRAGAVLLKGRRRQVVISAPQSHQRPSRGSSEIHPLVRSDKEHGDGFAHSQSAGP